MLTLDKNATIRATTAAEALFALSGMACSDCGKPLDIRNKKYSCCRRAHCPYCGKPHTERCIHRVAHREYGRWRIPGVIGEDAQPPLCPLEKGLLLDYSDAQKRAAFGAAEPMLFDIYGPGFLALVRKDALVLSLIHKVMRCESIQEVHGYDRYNHYCFSRDPKAAKERARQALRDLRQGFDNLRGIVPHAARYLLHTLDTGTSQWRGLNNIVFSPDGSQVLACSHSVARLFAVETGALVHCWDQGKGSIHSAVFSPGGERVAISTVISSSRGWDHRERTIGEGFVQVWDTRTGNPLSRMEGAPAGGDPLDSGSPSEGFLHGGRLFVLARERFVRLVDLEPSTGKMRPRGGIRELAVLPHREDIRQTAFSPDGVTFATSQKDYVLLWRIPTLATPAAEGGR